MLVDEGQAKFVVDGVRKERLELESRGGAIPTSVAALTAATDHVICSEGWIDRRPIKAVVYSNSHNNLLSVAEYLYESFDNQNIAELVEGRIDHVRLCWVDSWSDVGLIHGQRIIPFLHVLYMFFTSQMSYELGRFRHNYKEGKNCPVCGGWNEYTGKKLTSCKNRLLEVSDGNTTFLIEPERIIRAVGQVEYSSSDDMVARQLGNPVEMTRLQGAPLTKVHPMFHALILFSITYDDIILTD